MSKLQKNLLKYGITVAVGAGMVYLTLALNGYVELTELADKYRLIADSFTIPGVVIALSGFLVMVANDGLFYGLSYAVSYAVRMLVPGMDKTRERYGDYVERKRAKGKITGYSFLFITGIAFILVAVVFIILYYNV